MLIGREGISSELDFVHRMPVAKRLPDCILTALQGGRDHWDRRCRDNLVSREVSEQCTRSVLFHPLLPTARVGPDFNPPALGTTDPLQRSCLPSPTPNGVPDSCGACGACVFTHRGRQTLCAVVFFTLEGSTLFSKVGYFQRKEEGFQDPFPKTSGSVGRGA